MIVPCGQKCWGGLAGMEIVELAETD